MLLPTNPRERSKEQKPKSIEMYHFRAVSFTLIRMPTALTLLLNTSCGVWVLQHMLCDIHINLRAPQYQSTAGRVQDRLLALTFIFLLLSLCVMDKGDLQGRRGEREAVCLCPICFFRLYKTLWKVVCLVLGFPLFLPGIPDPDFSGFPGRHRRKLESSWD